MSAAPASSPLTSGIARMKEIFWPGPGGFFPTRTAGDVPVLPVDERKDAMRSLNAHEVKWSVTALCLAFVGGVAFPFIFTAENKVTKYGKNTVAVAPDAWLLGGVILLLFAIGMVAVWRRKRTLVCFDLILTGFALTPFIQLGGFLFIFLGGWLLIRAWRINKYGTTNSKAIAREAAARPRGRDRKAAATRSSTKTSKSSSGSDVRKAPTASKRYTPKAPPRKKIPKPTQ